MISCAVEGITDEAVLSRLIREAGASIGPIYGRNGKKQLLDRANGYNHAGRISPWIVLIDLDHDADCAPTFLTSRLPAPASYMHFRIAVKEVEAWLLADRERIANFLGVALSRIPRDPEVMDDPKRVIVDLARGSRRAEIRDDMVPRPEGGRAVGTAYSSRLIEFVSNPNGGWRPDVAAQTSDSLRRCIECVRKIVGN